MHDHTPPDRPHQTVLDRIAARMDNRAPVTHEVDIDFHHEGQFTGTEEIEAWIEVAAAIAWRLEHLLAGDDSERRP